MTTKEKAQKYDNAIGKAVALYKASEPMSGCNVIIETLFPELKESEDEKIRKWIIDDIRYNIDNEPLNNSEYKKQGERAIAWLEKQDEQKDFTPKVEPKFNCGDWITNGRYNRLVVGINSDWPYYMFKDGTSKRIKDIDKKYYLWTIQDAKDGDVLYINNTLSESIMIYKSFNNGVIDKYASCSKFGFEGENYLTLNDGYIIPATKEQHDLLFQKMHEAGYEWDEKKKKLKEIEKPTDVRTTGYWHVEDVEQKPTDEEMKRLLQTEYEKGRADAIAEMQKEWSEEDETTLNSILSCIKYCQDKDAAAQYLGNHFVNPKRYESISDWLKFLKSKVVNSKK